MKKAARLVLKVIKGMLIGVSVVIPGVSGGSIAMSVGIYDQLIDFLTISKGTKKKALFLLPYMTGTAIGVLVFAYFIERMLTLYPLRTSFLFIGLILGALPMLIRNVKGQKFRPGHALTLAVALAVMVVLPIASSNADSIRLLRPTLLHALLAAGLGFIAAATMVVPGVSGSMMMVLLGYYEPILRYVNTFTRALLRFDWPALLNTLAILAPFALGVFAGMMIMARLIRALIKRYPYATYYGVIGLVAAAPFVVIYQQNFSGVTGWAWAMGLLIALAGFLTATFFGGKEE
ncbi:MAG: DUF368 domain-containing protein [Clostridiales bacterium]|nr:DUF368 domain-containing protein [Clostridiales bacterium]